MEKNVNNGPSKMSTSQPLEPKDATLCDDGVSQMWLRVLRWTADAWRGRDAGSCVSIMGEKDNPSTNTAD